jgi:hypothetical protein
MSRCTPCHAPKLAVNFTCGRDLINDYFLCQFRDCARAFEDKGCKGHAKFFAVHESRQKNFLKSVDYYEIN